ncbi:MAG: hypothetical protein NZ933_06495 [Bacteroidia bacterium]|nr:hypothetical protein [Bacteroidia bacterium]
MRKVKKWLIGFSTLWAQFRIEATISYPHRDTLKPSSVILYLSHKALIYELEGSHKEKSYAIQYLFTPTQAYLIDKNEKKAYAVQPEMASPLELQHAIRKETSTSPEGYPAEEWDLLYPNLRIRVIWTQALPFEWNKWEKYLEADRIGAVARHFRRGIPLLIEQYEHGLLTWRFVVRRITSISEAEISDKPPFSVLPFIHR